MRLKYMLISFLISAGLGSVPGTGCLRSAEVPIIMWKYVPFTFRSSLRNKRRTFLTISSIGISLFLLGMLIAIITHSTIDKALPKRRYAW